MDKTLWDRAVKLAERPYQVRVYRDDEAIEEAVYLAEYTELYGCMAQGANVQDALANLKDAAKDYIYSLLEDGLEVPPPMLIAIQVGGAKTITPTITKPWHSTQQPEIDSGAVDQPTPGEPLYSYHPQSS